MRGSESKAGSPATPTPLPQFGEEFFHGGSGAPGSYGDYGNHRYVQEAEQLADALDELAPFAATRALDVGCAMGYLVSALRHRGVDAAGVDVSEFAISSAALDVVDYLAVCDLSVEALPFADHSFDLITCFGVLEYIVPDQLVFSELERVGAHKCTLVLHACARAVGIDDPRRNARSPREWVERFERHGFRVDRQASRAFWRRSRHDQLRLMHELGGHSELAVVHESGGPVGRWVAERYLAWRAKVNCDLVLRKEA